MPSRSPTVQEPSRAAPALPGRSTAPSSLRCGRRARQAPRYARRGGPTSVAMVVGVRDITRGRARTRWASFQCEHDGHATARKCNGAATKASWAPFRSERLNAYDASELTEEAVGFAEAVLYDSIRARLRVTVRIDAKLWRV